MLKKEIFSIIVVFIGFNFFISCSSDEPDNNGGEESLEVTEEIEIQDFIWQGLNVFYLWQEDVSVLADDRFETNNDYVRYLNAAPGPDDFFESLIYNRSSVDYWSWIVDDYIELEKLFQGVSKSNGVDFGLVRISGSDDVFGYVRYILPRSDAFGKPIKRGDIFTKVNGTQLTVDNYRTLLYSDDSYTLSLAKIENNTIIETGIDVDLTKYEYTENPVYVSNIIKKGGKSIGYLMYNSFTANFDNELNDAFLQFKNEGIDELVLDLRYNGGGSVRSSLHLSSMITGQFKGELYTREEWNSKLQAQIESESPQYLINNFTDKLADGSAINSLNLDKVHIIVTNRSASASELVINGLKPYINVRLVGEQTVGKYVASITLYDSQNFTKTNVNTRHNYAMQPIVLQELNKLGENDKDGFEPDISISEDFADLGMLGDEDEKLLEAAINDIIGAGQKPQIEKSSKFNEIIGDSKMNNKLSNEMYIDKDEVRKLFKKENLIKSID